MLNLARLENKYLADEEPWKRIKDQPERVPTIMHIALQIAAALSSICEPFLPHSANELRSILNISHPLSWNEIATKTTHLEAGHQIGAQRLLFEKIEDEVIVAQREKLEATKVANEETATDLPPQKELISFEDFSQLDLRVGTILTAEKVKKTKKLLQLEVDMGNEVRTIVSGIAESFSPEEVVGRKVTVLTNLAPRTIRGVESQGMLLMTEDKDGKTIIVSPGRRELKMASLFVDAQYSLPSHLSTSPSRRTSFPYGKIRLASKAIAHEGSCEEEDFFTPEKIPNPLIEAVHCPDYLQRLLALELDKKEVRKLVSLEPTTH